MPVGWLGLLGWGSSVRVGGESKNGTFITKVRLKLRVDVLRLYRCSSEVDNSFVDPSE